MRSLVDFVAVVLAALIAGATFGILFGYNPAGVSGPAYVEVQQVAIRGLNVLLPLIAALCILLVLFDAWLSRAGRGRMVMLLVAAAILIAGGLITRFGNQPINAIVATWNAHSPPPEWEALRDRWWHWHVIRTWIALFGFAVLLIATRMKAATD